MSVLQYIHEAFSKTMETPHRTYLKGGGEEPIYLPPTDKEYGVIQYAQDYPRSALHELAHWCIAGEERRKKEDYGYWYVPDGRNPEQQESFFQVEVKPQALELLFCKVGKIPFRVSVDNLEGARGEGEMLFEQKVLEQAEKYQKRGLPSRANALYKAFESSFNAK